MMPLRIAGATHKFVAPEGMPDVRPLFVRKVNGVCYSHWELTPAEIAAINIGGVVRLAIVGSQPPVGLCVALVDDGLDQVALPFAGPGEG